MRAKTVLSRTGLLIVTAGILFGGAMAQFGSKPRRIKQPLPSTIDLTNANLIEIKDSTGQVVLSGTLTTTSELSDEIERNATFAASAAYPDAKGKVEVELARMGDRFTEQELEATVEGLRPATEFKLVVDGNEVASFTTDNSGKREMKFSRKE
jgi:hypothetical protein